MTASCSVPKSKRSPWRMPLGYGQRPCGRQLNIIIIESWSSSLMKYLGWFISIVENCVCLLHCGSNEWNHGKAIELCPKKRNNSVGRKNNIRGKMFDLLTVVYPYNSPQIWNTILNLDKLWWISAGNNCGQVDTGCKQITFVTFRQHMISSRNNHPQQKVSWFLLGDCNDSYGFLKWTIMFLFQTNTAYRWKVEPSWIMLQLQLFHRLRRHPNPLSPRPAKVISYLNRQPTNHGKPNLDLRTEEIWKPPKVWLKAYK